jgi:inhibitor of KinA sporulation pathway (predicted exonuclease)
MTTIDFVATTDTPSSETPSSETAAILVIDLETTCADDGSIPPGEMEIIEIGAVWATLDGMVQERFQSFVQPVLRPQLTPYCRQLTSIQQSDIDAAQPFPVAAAALRAFADRHRQPDSIWMSWGAHDRGQIDRDCLRHSVADPLGMAHQNAKKLFSEQQKISKRLSMGMVCKLTGVVFEGTSHRALDDAINIARLLPWVSGKRSLTV